MPTPRTRWTDEELDKLRDLAPKIGARKASEELGRTYQSVRKAMDRYGIKSIPQHRWHETLTEDEKAARRKTINDKSHRVYATRLEGKRTTARRRLYKLHRDIAEALGNKCKRCPETSAIVLQAHHVEHDGADHKREVRASGIDYYKDVLRMAQEEPERLELLCANCHLRHHRLHAGWTEE
jgi:hypothetical protein